MNLSSKQQDPSIQFTQRLLFFLYNNIFIQLFGCDLVLGDTFCLKLISQLNLKDFLFTVNYTLLKQMHFLLCTDAVVFLNESQDIYVSALVDKNKKMSKSETEAG